MAVDMASMQQLETALINADKAGDTQAATVLAQEIQKMRGAGPSEIPGPRIFIPRPFETISNVPSSAGKFIGGLVEAVASPVQTAKGLADIAAGGMRAGAKTVLPKKVFNWIDALDDPETTKRITDTANAVGKDYADAYGSYDQIIKTIEQDPVRAAGDLSMILGLAAKAATAGRMAQTGEALSGAARVIDPLALPIAGVNKLAEVAAPTISSARNALSPQYRMLEPALEGRGEEYVTALLNRPQEIVPGSRRSAGEMIVASGQAGTQFPALEQKVLSQFNPTQQFEIEAARGAARSKSIGEISGTPEAQQSAVEARTAATKPLYQRAAAKLAETDETFANLMDTPTMDEALATASRMAADRQQPFMRGEIKPAETVKSGILGAAGEELTREIPAQTAKLSGQALQDIKIALDEAVKPRANETNAQAAQRNAATGVRAQYMDWLEKNAPDLMKARATFAEKSAPINVMEVGQVLKTALESPLDETASRAGVFANAVRNAPATLKKATGEARFERLSDVLETGDLKRVANVLEDLRVSKEYKDLAKAGRVEAEGLSGAQLPAPKGFLNRVATVSNRILEAVEGRINRAAAIKIAEAAYDPQRMAAMIQEVMAMDKRNAAREASFRATAQRAANAMRGTAPAVNMLAIQAQQDQ